MVFVEKSRKSLEKTRERVYNGDIRMCEGDGMLDRVLGTIQRYDMINRGDRILVGVSGGADSLALLSILSQLQESLAFRVYAAHINHGLRGEAAREDADFVASICRQWKIPFFLHETDVEALSRAWGVSEEAAGRKVRYAFFDEVLNKIRGHKIALAHHMDDQIETILHHILRGTGMQGLQGMQPVRENKYIRPFLEISRRDIEAYCLTNRLAFRQDTTNQDITYTRNRIRLELIPYIRENFNPNFTEALLRMSSIVREEEEFIHQACLQLFEQSVCVREDSVEIDRPLLRGAARALQRRVVRMAIEKLNDHLMGIEMTHVDKIIEMATDLKAGASINLPGDVKVYNDYKGLVLFRGSDSSPIEFCERELTIPGMTRIEELGMEFYVDRVSKESVLTFSPSCIFIDGNKITGNLKVRQRRPGDRFKPLGMKGSKKLKDFFIDRKVPRRERDAVPIVTDDLRIIWVVGHQMSEDCKLDREANHIIRVCARVINSSEGAKKTNNEKA